MLGGGNKKKTNKDFYDSKPWYLWPHCFQIVSAHPRHACREPFLKTPTSQEMWFETGIRGEHCQSHWPPGETPSLPIFRKLENFLLEDWNKNGK